MTLPTDAELEILHVLWDGGPATVRAVHEALRGDDAAYTTTLKLLQIMLGKGLVERDERDRAHVYRAAVARGETERGLVSDLAERAFGGSAARMVMHALQGRTATPEELREIVALAERLERDGEVG